MLEKVINLVTEMREPLLRSGLSLEQIAYKREKLDKATDKQLMEAYGWLSGFQIYINDFNRAYRLCPPEVWERYKKFRIVGLQEQILLNAATKVLHEEWKKRPPILRKKNVKDGKTGSGSKSARKHSRTHEKKRQSTC